MSGSVIGRHDAEPAAAADRGRVAVPARVAAPDGDEGLLIQTGEIAPRHKPDDFEVFYPRPYAHPPELKVIDRGPMIVYAITEQHPHGFKLNVSAREVGDTVGRYQARGVAAK